MNEIDNVNSEFLIYKKKDYFIYNDLLKTNIENNFNYSFSIGNNNTLIKENIYNDLKNFYEEYYFAENMNLFIFTNDNNINEIKNNLKCFEQIKSKNKINSNNEINKKFSIIKNKNKCYKININNYDTTGTIILFYSLNIKMINIFYFMFLIYLMNKKSYNSLYYVLYSNNLISKLYFNINDFTKDFIIIKLEIKQTYYGTKHEDIILTAIINYLNYLKQSITKEYYNIYINSLKLNYMYQNKDNDIENYIYNINNNIDYMYYTNLTLDKIINYNIIYKEFDKDKFKEMIDYLDIRNSMIILNNYKYSKFKYETKYFNTKFLIEDNNFIIKDIDFKFDISNKFIDKDTEYKINSLNINNNLLLNNKNKIYYNDNIIIYTKTNNILDEKCYIKLEFIINDVYDDIYKYFYFNLFVYIINKNIYNKIENELLYGLEYDLYIKKNRINLEINGYNFNIEKILKFILENLFEFKLNEKEFYKYKQELINEIINQEKYDFEYKLIENLKYILYDKYYLLKNNINKLNDIEFIDDYKIKIREINSLIITKQNINNLKNIISYYFNNYKDKINKEKNYFEFKDIDKIKDKYLINTQIKNYILDYILIVKNINYKDEVIISIIKEILDNYFFNEFRKDKHYGYTCSIEKINFGYKEEIITLNFIINISDDNINKIDIIKKDVKNFINNKIIKIINNLDEKELNKQKESLINIFIFLIL